MNLHYLRAVGGARKIKKKLNDFSRLTKEKKEKNCFFKLLESFTIFLNIIPYQFSPTVFLSTHCQLFWEALFNEIKMF